MNSGKGRLLSIVLTAAGILLMTIGIWQGEAAEVLAKGTRICLECIGIG